MTAVQTIIEAGGLLDELTRRYKRNVLLIAFIVIGVTVDGGFDINELSLFGISPDEKFTGATIILFFLYNFTRFVLGSYRCWQKWTEHFMRLDAPIPLLGDLSEMSVFAKKQRDLRERPKIAITAEGLTSIRRNETDEQEFLQKNIQEGYSVGETMSFEDFRLVRKVLVESIVIDIALPFAMALAAWIAIAIHWR